MTKKIKESTTAGAVAPSVGTVGKMHKRAGSMFKGKKTNKPFYESKPLSWSDIDEGLSVENKIIIFEEYYTKGNLTESIDEDKREYFTSLFNMSGTPEKNKKYIVVPLSLVGNKIIPLDTPNFMTYVGKSAGQLVFKSSKKEVRYPSKTMRDLSVFNTFTFSDSDSYDKFRVALALKFDIDLPPVKITRDSNMKKNTRNRMSESMSQTVYKPKVGDKVHAGHGQKGGAGVTGTVTKIENDHVFFKNDEGRTFKAHIKKVSRALDEAEINEQDLIILPGMRRSKDTSFIPHTKDRRDHEVEMARSDVYVAAKDAMRIFKLLKDRSEDQGIMGWQQSYITLASDYLNSVADSMEYQAQLSEMTGGVLAGGMSNFEEGADIKYFYITVDGKDKFKSRDITKARAMAEKMKKDPMFDSKDIEVVEKSDYQIQVSEELMNEKKDACYHKVKSRYKVWPSAYASGALVQCRKKGASNWGKGKKK